MGSNEGEATPPVFWNAVRSTATKITRSGAHWHSVASCRRRQKCGNDGWAEVETKDRFAVGNLLEVLYLSDNLTVRLTEMKSLDGKGCSRLPLGVCCACASPWKAR